MEPTIVAAIMTIGFSLTAALVGLVYRNLKSRVESLEAETDGHDEDFDGLKRKVETLWKWAFGREQDETDAGIAEEINENFNKIEDDISKIRDRQQTYHEVEMDALERVANQLHDEEEIDIDRGDILSDDD